MRRNVRLPKFQSPPGAISREESLSPNSESESKNNSAAGGAYVTYADADLNKAIKDYGKNHEREDYKISGYSDLSARNLGEYLFNRRLALSSAHSPYMNHLKMIFGRDDPGYVNGYAGSNQNLNFSTGFWRVVGGRKKWGDITDDDIYTFGNALGISAREIAEEYLKAYNKYYNTNENAYTSYDLKKIQEEEEVEPQEEESGSEEVEPQEEESGSEEVEPQDSNSNASSTNTVNVSSGRGEMPSQAQSVDYSRQFDKWRQDVRDVSYNPQVVRISPAPFYRFMGAYEKGVGRGLKRAGYKELGRAVKSEGRDWARLGRQTNRAGKQEIRQGKRANMWTYRNYGILPSKKEGGEIVYDPYKPNNNY